LTTNKQHAKLKQQPLKKQGDWKMYIIQWNHTNSTNYNDEMRKEFETYEEAKRFYKNTMAGFKSNLDAIVDIENMIFHKL